MGSHPSVVGTAQHAGSLAGRCGERVSFAVRAASSTRSRANTTLNLSPVLTRDIQINFIPTSLTSYCL